MVKGTISRSVGGFGRLHIVAAVIAFVVGIIVFIPADVVASIAARQNSGFTYAGASGTIWRGRVNRIVYNDVPVGDLVFSTDPFGLLTGRIGVAVEFGRGALTGSARLIASFNRVTVENLHADFRLSSIRRYSFFGAPYRGDLKLDITRLRLAKSGCLSGSGTVWTNALTISARNWNMQGFDVSGPLMCEEGALSANLSGAGVEGRLNIAATINADLSYLFVASAEPKRSEVYEALQLFSFEPKDGVLSYTAVGQLKGVEL